MLYLIGEIMSIARIQDFDPDLIADLRDELVEKRQKCTDHLLLLEENPDDINTLHVLFRDVHTVKGDVGIMGIHQYVPLLQAIEDILDTLRSKSRQYSPALGDVLLLSLDLTFRELTHFIKDDTLFDPKPYNKLAHMVSKLAELDGHAAEQQTLAIVQLLAPETARTKDEDGKQTKSYFDDAEINEEIAFFLQMSLLLDSRSPYGPGRTERMFELGLTMNKIAGDPINTYQLQAAIYLHDLAMGFMPKGMVSKASALSQHDWQWVKNHVSLIHQLISPFDVWDEAALIILHHHERIDGSGYPAGLTGDNICEGAKLLAIIDSYEAITQPRTYQDQQQRPMIRAIMEINQNSESLYCPRWVEHFNQAIKRLHVKKS
jgi:response regulator RpfG family c-di-GMP phosphodiesterase